MPYRLLRLLVVVLASSRSLAAAEKAFPLQGGETVIFFGDSITQNGGYVNYFEAYLLTRFPGKEFTVLNHGISSETISGTSEEDHHPRRPWALPRFTRDITRWKPDVVIACFGMNDGNYHPFEPVRFRKYQDGIRTLIRRTRDEAHARLILMTPPPYDPYRRRVSDPEAKSFGYKFAAVDYDETLRRYSEFVVSLRKEGQTVVDLHSQMNAHLKARRQQRVSYSFSPDAVHPNPTGHWLMAQFLLLELKAPATAAELHIDAGAGKITQAIGGKAELVQCRNDGVSLNWTASLPFPMDPLWDADSIRLERTAERLNRYRLRLTGLKKGPYRLSVNGRKVAILTARQLAGGVNLLDFENLPTVAASRNLLKKIQERRRLRYRLWRTRIGKPLGKALSPSQQKQAEERIEELSRQIDELRKPQKLAVVLSPAKNQ